MVRHTLSTWRCACGRIHEIDGKTIICSGPGHYVEIRPAYWNINEPTKPKSKNPQLFLL